MATHPATNFGSRWHWADDLDDFVLEDEIEGPGQDLNNHDHSDTNGAPVKRVAFGAAADRPAAGNEGHLYVSLDSGIFSYDDGVNWHDCFALSGTAVPVADGGTGLTTLTAHAVLVGAGTSDVALVGPGGAGLPLLGGGAAADPAYGQVGTAGIADSAVTSAKIADGTIVTGDLADGAVTSAKIADGSITGGDIAGDTIAGGNIVPGTITATELANPVMGSGESLTAITDNSGGSVGALSAATTITTHGRPVVVLATAGFTCTADGHASLWIKQDSGAWEIVDRFFLRSGSTSDVAMKGWYIFTPAAGSHTYTVGWSHNGSISADQSSIVAFEIA